MVGDYIFSWAENAEGRMVHVDSVPRGLQCGCICPNCHEKLLARHGEVKEHGFAHHSDKRGANLKICYMVILYKLAEQIIQIKKRIHVPSYYGIFKENDIEFTDVKVDSRYERLDKQPDVIATTIDGRQYLVEFVFNYKAQHKQAIDYKNLTCLEVDLSKQTLESLEEFLLNSNEDRVWLNNEDYFGRIVDVYSHVGKRIRIVEESECHTCELFNVCCAINQPGFQNTPIPIENSGKKYRLCKTELYEQRLEELKQRKAEEAKRRQDELLYMQEQARLQQEEEQKYQERMQQRRREYEEQRRISDELEAQRDPSERSCFDCQSNLTWMNRNGYANCGSYISRGVPKFTPPDYAKTCRGFRRKLE